MLKKIIFAILIVFILLYFFADLTNKSDYCLEDGDCKVGDVIYINSDEKAVIDKNTCLTHGWEWFEKTNTCKVK